MTVKMVTLKDRGSLDDKTAHGILRRCWDRTVVDNVTSMKVLSDNSGVCFDIQSSQVQIFMEKFDDLKNNSG